MQKDNLISRQAAIDAIEDYLDEYSGLDEEGYHGEKWCAMAEAKMVIENLPSAQPEQPSEIQDILNYLDTVLHLIISPEHWNVYSELHDMISMLPSAQPERKWIPCSNPPKHHKDVIVRGIEAIGNVTVHKVMQWDVDTWRPTDYAPSIMWKEWSEI